MLDHVLIGAVTGGLIQNSPAAFTFSTSIHLLLDKVPHYFPNKRLKQIITILIDLILCTSAFYIFWNVPFPKSVFWGALGGIWIDLLLVGVPPVFHSKIGQWHVNRQPHHTKEVFILLDIVVIIVCVTALITLFSS